jgi:hypothetical protein
MSAERSAVHPRRSDREIVDTDEIKGIISSQKFLTIAMCSGGEPYEPYLVTLSYGYDPDQQCFFFHCAPDGRKIDILLEHPTVWGQIIQDRGYLAGECAHAYSSVEFRGTVSFLESTEEKAAALCMMIDQLEPDPEPVKEKQVLGKDLGNVCVGRIDVEAFSGKKAH